MRLDKPVVGNKQGFRGAAVTILDTDPQAWIEYLDGRKINEKVAQRRINQIRASRTAALSGRKAEL